MTCGHDVDSSAIVVDAGGPLVDGGVHLLEELHRLEVLAAAVLVRRPLALLAGVVEVEHRRDAVDPQPVGVELLEPVERVGVEEVAHLVPAEVEDVRAPLLVPAALGVGVLVERGAVEAGQRPLVGGEVAGHPVEDHADPGLVQPVDEQPEAVGVAEPRVRGEVRRHVVAPRAAERVLHHRHQLDVGEARGRTRYAGQLVGQLLPASCPRRHEAEVHLVDRHRLVRRAAWPAGRPSTPGRPTRRCDSKTFDAVSGGHLGPGRHRVGLLAPLAVGAEDDVLVGGAGADAGHEQLPHAGLAELAHRVLAAVPAVEVGLEPDRAGRRRPDRERRAGDRLAERARRSGAPGRRAPSTAARGGPR